MANELNVTFSKYAPVEKGVLITTVGDDLTASEQIAGLDAGANFARAFSAIDFKGALASTAEILAPAGGALERLVAVGVGAPSARNNFAWLRAGGAAASMLRKASEVTVVLAAPDMTAADVAQFAAGMQLRAYVFDKYKSKDKDAEAKRPKSVKATIQCADPAAAKKAFANLSPVVDGVILARDLVNEPANALGPVEFAAAAKELESLGVEVEILTEKDMKKLGMGSLLGVAQGSVRPPRLAVMRWTGGRKGVAPVAFVGKGVVFDTGGNSMKTAAGMEDMKGDMGGAAAVVGAMRALAGRKAKANVVGFIGLVENMVDGAAQRPGDIVKSMSGQTIEVMNTDAEGRLVLADVLTYCEQTVKPTAIIDLATLTGAVMVALGQFHTGLFSNNDELAAQLTKAGLETQERVWRLPMGDEYDKLINTKNADMKNVGGRYGGSITAAQFLQRFVNDTPWAHLDIAGTAMGVPNTDINQSWGTGVGVRLLDQYIRDNHEG